MPIVVDTSVIIAVITNEEHKRRIVRMTKGADLIAPASLHWEIGNAFSAMFKRKRITLQEAQAAVGAYQTIPLRLCDVDLDGAIELAERLGIYVYDAYVIRCALKYRSPLLSLDQPLIEAARKAGATVKEIES